MKKGKPTNDPDTNYLCIITAYKNRKNFDFTVSVQSDPDRKVLQISSWYQVVVLDKRTSQTAAVLLSIGPSLWLVDECVLVSTICDLVADEKLICSTITQIKPSTGTFKNKVTAESLHSFALRRQTFQLENKAFAPPRLINWNQQPL